MYHDKIFANTVKKCQLQVGLFITEETLFKFRTHQAKIQTINF